MNKIVTVTNKEIIEKLREKATLLYPLNFFSIGYEEYYDILEIDDYCLINRILNDEEIDKLDKILHQKNNIKGIVFDDLGIIDITKDLNIKKILLLDHLATNSESINYYLDYVDSVVVSNDLCKDEILEVLKKAKKPLVVFVFGLKTLMYSRRHLLSNYEKHYNLEKEFIMDANIDNKYFKIIENEFGTKFYAYPYYEALDLLNSENVLYFWYDPLFLNPDDLDDVLKGKLDNIKTSRYFLENKTIYKVGDIDA